MALPLNNARITYCYKTVNSRYRKGYHTGIDMANSDYKILAPIAGTVIQVGSDPSGWGYYVIVRSDNEKYDMIFCHMSKQLVSSGQWVRAGMQLGVMGNTGQSFGDHLHFEVRNAPWQNCDDINPCVFLGIKNQIGNVESVSSGGNYKVKSIVLVSHGVDERCAGYLADYLQCSIAFKGAIATTELDQYETVYEIGGTSTYTRAKFITGSNRYETCRNVLALIK